jgi:hypothetical protein
LIPSRKSIAFLVLDVEELTAVACIEVLRDVLVDGEYLDNVGRGLESW